MRKEKKTDSEQKQSDKKIIEVELQKLEWPKDIKAKFPVDIFFWLIGDDLSPAAIEAVAKDARVHVIPKPRARKEAYLVVGGFLYYCLLLKAGWEENIECILDHSIGSGDLGKLVYKDVCLDFYCCKGGPLATAAKAAILTELILMGEKVRTPSFFNISSRYFTSGNNIMKELVGFDSRSFRQANKKWMDKTIQSKIEAILHISSSSADNSIAKANSFEEPFNVLTK